VPRDGKQDSRLELGIAANKTIPPRRARRGDGTERDVVGARVRAVHAVYAYATSAAPLAVQ
jgi:hypothetical protein